jgi:hypothetical protein
VSDDWNPGDPDEPRVLYDLSEWTFDQQAEVAAELAEAEIPHGWDGSELMVPEVYERRADDLIDSIEQRFGIVYDDDADGADGAAVDVDEVIVAADDVAADAIDISEGEPTTEYELGDWPEIEREAVSRALTLQRNPFRWVDGILLVHTSDEEVVDSLLDMVENGEVGIVAAMALPAEEDDDDDRMAIETLTVFFLAGERLRRDPLDADGIDQLLEAIELAEPDQAPYGVEPKLWARTCELADELAGALVDEDEPDEQAAMEIAEQLHDLLRPYI